MIAYRRINANKGGWKTWAILTAESLLFITIPPLVIFFGLRAILGS